MKAFTFYSGYHIKLIDLISNVFSVIITAHDSSHFIMYGDKRYPNDDTIEYVQHIAKRSQMMKRKVALFLSVSLLISGIALGESLPPILNASVIVPDPGILLGEGELIQKNMAFRSIEYDAYYYPSPQNQQQFEAAYLDFLSAAGISAIGCAQSAKSDKRIEDFNQIIFNIPAGKQTQSAYLLLDYGADALFLVPSSCSFVPGMHASNPKGNARDVLDGTSWITAENGENLILTFSEGICTVSIQDPYSKKEEVVQRGPYKISDKNINLMDENAEWGISGNTLSIIMRDNGNEFRLDLKRQETADLSSIHSFTQKASTSGFSGTHWHATGFSSHLSAQQADGLGDDLSGLAGLFNLGLSFVASEKELDYAFQSSLITAYFGIDFYSNGTWEVHYRMNSRWTGLWDGNPLESTTDATGTWEEENGRLVMFASQGAPVPLEYNNGILSIRIFGLGLDFVQDK